MNYINDVIKKTLVIVFNITVKLKVIGGARGTIDKQKFCDHVTRPLETLNLYYLALFFLNLLWCSKKLKKFDSLQ